jgi:hypothetical protein
MMQNHIHKNAVQKIIALPLKSASDGQVIPAAYKGFLSSDQEIFHTSINGLADLYLEGIPHKTLNQFLVLIHKDSSADIYVNEFPIILTLFSKREIQAGSIVKMNDILDISELHFDDIDVKEDDCLVFCFRIEWKFGQYFNLSPANGIPLYLNEVKKELGEYYKLLLFEKAYSIIADPNLFKKLFQDGWFPFIELMDGEYECLSEAYREEFIGDPNSFINRIVENFNETRIMTIADRWWRVPYYKDKKLILMTGINAFLKSNEEGYIACIRTLYPEIEGIIRFSYLNENNKSANDTKELLN